MRSPILRTGPIELGLQVAAQRGRSMRRSTAGSSTVSAFPRSPMRKKSAFVLAFDLADLRLSKAEDHSELRLR